MQEYLNSERDFEEAIKRYGTKWLPSQHADVFTIADAAMTLFSTKPVTTEALKEIGFVEFETTQPGVSGGLSFGNLNTVVKDNVRKWRWRKKGINAPKTMGHVACIIRGLQL